MTWTTRADLRAQVERLWERGILLQAVADGTRLFPRRLQFKHPGAGEIVERFEEVRRWAAEVSATPHCRIASRTFNHRLFGTNSLPHEAWLDSMEDALDLIGKRRAVARYRSMLGMTQERLPALLPWLRAKPLRALDMADVWPTLLAVVGWLSVHPRPGIYLRQVDLPGMHSKFIEQYRGILSELFDLALPPEAIDNASSGLAGFAQRYGFRDKPQRLRFRILDPAAAPCAGYDKADITLDAATFANTPIAARQVFVTENEVNFLAFPATPDSIVVFGAGYGWEMLADARWLLDRAVVYWGDIDTHGFAILDQLRRKLPHVVSMMMDEATLMAHRHCWGTEKAPIAHELPLLDSTEAALYDLLRYQRLAPSLRLEQELVGFDWVTQSVVDLTRRHA